MKVWFKYPKSVDELDDLPDLFQRKKDKSSCNNDILGESILLDRLRPC